MISQINYEPKTKYLEVVFERDAESPVISKTYLNVDPPAVDAFRASESKEFHYFKYIKPVYKEVARAGNQA